jgi:hypothetical protein
MSGSNARPKIYHIVHVDRLASIIRTDGLLSDAALVDKTELGTTIGMSDIKQRRLVLPVNCHDKLMVGECVPFYFCSRSVMLYLLHKSNHPNLHYTGGQAPILHLEADMCEVIEWSNKNGKRWAFTLGNAATCYVEFRKNLDDLDQINWAAVAARVWRDPDVKEGKQAEFLVEDTVPWTLFRRIGVINNAYAAHVANLLCGATHRPAVEIKPQWYY